MTITDSTIKQMIVGQVSLPFMHNFIEEYKSRKISHMSKIGCPSCRGPVYDADILAKAKLKLQSLSESDKTKLQAYLNTKEDITVR